MMNPALEKGFQKILTGQVKFSSQLLPMNLMLTRFTAKYKSAPNARTLVESMAEIEMFVLKYNAMLASDLAKIEHL